MLCLGIWFLELIVDISVWMDVLPLLDEEDFTLFALFMVLELTNLPIDGEIPNLTEIVALNIKQ
jgi:hypothetical protein